MKRQEATITLKSIQHDIDETEQTQVYHGHYAAGTGEHLINYREHFDTDSPETGVIKNLIKITNKTFTIKKTGATTSTMFFRNQTAYQGVYRTPFGSFDLKVFTKKLEIEAGPEDISVFINYDLHLNQAFVSNCTIQIQVTLH